MFFYDKIICPYCHGKEHNYATFGHKDVHFRMETYFENEEDLNDEGKSIAEIRRMPDSPAKAKLQEQRAQNLPFLSKDDHEYKRFWEEFGGTTEVRYGNDTKLPINPYQLPVLDPSDRASWNVLKCQSGNGDRREDYFLYDGDGMVMGIMDIHGKKTFRRLCPFCHNPLPTGYGKYETKYISVIGVTNSGKTVYISQLLKHIAKYANYVTLDAYFTSDHEPSFIESNPVKYNVQLPRPTKAEQLSQPMYYDLVQKKPGGVVQTHTIVIYDIAGENCAKAQAMEQYGDFVTRSDGIILLLDPNQLGPDFCDQESEGEEIQELTTVLNTIHGAFRQRKSESQVKTPMAVCISKADMVRKILPDQFSDIEPVRDPDTHRPCKKFNASSYNTLERVLESRLNQTSIHNALSNSYENFNYFAFSATGCNVIKRGELSYPVSPPMPLRIAEPLLWLLFKFGIIGSDVPIRLPVPREMPQTVEEVQPGFLPFIRKTVTRPLNQEEKDRYWYEAHT